MSAIERQPGTTRSVLITGGAGFIGSHLVDWLLANGRSVTVLDNINDFYSPSVKRLNVVDHLKHPNYRLIEGDIRDSESLSRAFDGTEYDAVVHLAAMAGVRPSLQQPSLYMDVNVNGTQRVIDHMLQTCPTARLVFGSSSSVYGERSGESFSETDRVDQPLSPYAASKAAGELICYAAHHTRKLQVVCLRFFTVFGPRQRPDLAIHKFCRLIDQGKEVEVFGDGSSKRDYTYVGDIVNGIVAAAERKLSGYDIINLGRSEPVILKDMIGEIESALGKPAKLVHKPIQMGDVPYTYANIDQARKLLGYEPQTSFSEGIKRFVDWYVASKVVVS